ncbi:hypothetical protein BCD_1833 (plasmid) [Borrelia crocidurae DOU]|uniref:Uncharacterized protein n=1 Tax=Borrelia crocidurae DOU TaxID=1293575 RepID=W5SL86_9SPIR|nr:hypothetical protein BCD_1833 [Borrelia crocidurae DOU]
MWCNINSFGFTYIEEEVVVSSNTFSILCYPFKRLNKSFNKSVKSLNIIKNETYNMIVGAFK